MLQNIHRTNVYIYCLIYTLLIMIQYTNRNVRLNHRHRRRPRKLALSKNWLFFYKTRWIHWIKGVPKVSSRFELYKNKRTECLLSSFITINKWDRCGRASSAMSSSSSRTSPCSCSPSGAVLLLSSVILSRWQLAKWPLAKKWVFFSLSPQNQIIFVRSERQRTRHRT